MGQTLNGNVDTSSTNGFTQGVPQKAGSPAWLWDVQYAEWKALARKNGFDPNNYPTSVGAPEKNAPQPIFNAVEPTPSPIVKNADGSVVGQIPGTNVVCNLPAKLA